MNYPFIREFGQPAAFEDAAQILSDMMSYLEVKLSRAAENQAAEEDWAKRWRDCMARNVNPFKEIPINDLPGWARMNYYQIRALIRFFRRAAEIYCDWQRECDMYYKEGIARGRELELSSRDERSHPYYRNRYGF